MTGSLSVPDRTRHSRILGLGVYRPERVVASAELAPRLGLGEAWILKRSGVRSRRFASPEETLTMMAEAAAGKALAAAGVTAPDVGCVTDKNLAED